MDLNPVNNVPIPNFEELYKKQNLNINEIKKRDNKYKNNIYKIDLLQDNHISKIVLGKKKKFPNEGKENYMFYIYLVNKNNKVDKENGCIGYLTVEKEKFDSNNYYKYLNKNNDLEDDFTIDIKKYNKIPTLFNNSEEIIKNKEYGIYKEYTGDFYNVINDDIITDLFETNYDIGKDKEDDMGEDMGEDESDDMGKDEGNDMEEDREDDLGHDEEKKEIKYTNIIQKYFKNKNFENPMNSEKDWKPGDCFFSSIAYAIYYEYKVKKNNKKKLKKLLTNIGKMLKLKPIKPYDILGLRKFAYKVVSEKEDLSENKKMQKQLILTHKKNKAKVGNIKKLYREKKYETIITICNDVMGFNEDITQKYVLNNIDKIKEELNRKLRTDLEFINSIPMHQYTEEDMVKNGDTWADNTIIGEMIKQFHNEKYFPLNTGLNIIIFNAQELKKKKKDITNIFSCFKGINNILDLNVLIYYNGLDHYQLVKYNDKAILTREELNDIPKFMEIYNKYCIETPKSKPKSSKSKKPKSKKPKSKKSKSKKQESKKQESKKSLKGRGFLKIKKKR